MKDNLTQLSAATALVQLLEEHPELSEHMSWSISRVGVQLVGFIHEGGMQVLADCAKFLGGSVRADESTYESGGQRLRTHVLASTWRDVPVQVLLPLPVAAEQVAA
ncbi:hypothetical protein [Streptomyces viridochromogenes]|uniref:hypothetical protein n=1 Tax=Streptomyces viridochromogenes TaxID=1938 RepID=UPI00069F22F5|nr:hypothetical protein [Streptomyces viridochromogenes]KOG21758.1 hypothetical protein ADK36_12290 [Streptomyces viridochromogenes]